MPERDIDWCGDDSPGDSAAQDRGRWDGAELGHCPFLALLKVSGAYAAPTLERQLRVHAGIPKEGQEEGPEHLGALVIGGEDVEQPPALLAAVPAGKGLG